MKKSICISLTLLVYVILSTLAQNTQLKNWYIAPNYAELSTLTPTANPIPTVFTFAPPPPANRVTNGIYDNSLNNNLIFYIADCLVYHLPLK